MVLTANPTLIAIGQEETPSEEASSEETTAEEETTTAEEEVPSEETTEELPEETSEPEVMLTMVEEVKSPKKQMDEGVEAGAVVCKEGLDLIIKASTGSAACVKSSSVEILIARGWGSTPA
ncbi:MAG: hypothetical protein Q8Q69_06610 [Nitrosopumilaceae archaeon]|nr:hypothetical protein [Nitrosopumilaceae archaeon]